MRMQILILSVMFYSSLVSAMERLWPSQFNMSQVIFTPGLPYRFSDIEGLAKFEGDASTLDHYLLVSPHPEWPERQSCDLPSRGTGYIQTTEVTNEFADYLAIVGVPIFIQLRSSFLGKQKIQLLNSSLLTISILKLDLEDFQLKSLAEFKTTFRNLCELDPNCRAAIGDETLPVNLNLDRPILTTSFLFPRGEEIRVRVSWSALGVCDEDFLKFKMGDQIRILAMF